MMTALYAAGASLPLLLGALLGVWWRPPTHLLAMALAYAAGALIAALSFDLFQESYEMGGGLVAGPAFAAGALTFVVADYVLDRTTSGSATGWALLAGVTLDGVPENMALGVSLTGAGSLALLVAVFASNFPEALAGAVSMHEEGRSRTTVVAIWAGATLLLAGAVVLGRFAFSGASAEVLAFPLAFAGGAVLASVIDTLAPDAFRQGGPWVALASAAGFVTGFMLSL